MEFEFSAHAEPGLAFTGTKGLKICKTMAFQALLRGVGLLLCRPDGVQEEVTSPGVTRALGLPHASRQSLHSFSTPMFPGAQDYPSHTPLHPKEGLNKLRITLDEALSGPHLGEEAVWLWVVLGSMTRALCQVQIWMGACLPGQGF